MQLILFVAFAFTICSAHADQPFIEIAGVKITWGMDETSVRAAFYEVSCDEDTPKSCSVGDGIPPEYDGEVTFEDGRVRSAVRNLPLPEDPGEVLMLLYNILERVASADRTCAQVQLSSSDSGLKTIAIGFLDKALWIQTRDLAKADVFDYIEVFYNRTRRHSHLGGVSPEAFELASQRGSVVS